MITLLEMEIVSVTDYPAFRHSHPAVNEPQAYRVEVALDHSIVKDGSRSFPAMDCLD
jgi:hypothetical protein